MRACVPAVSSHSCRQTGTLFRGAHVIGLIRKSFSHPIETRAVLRVYGPLRHQVPGPGARCVCVGSPDLHHHQQPSKNVMRHHKAFCAALRFHSRLIRLCATPPPHGVLMSHHHAAAAAAAGERTGARPRIYEAARRDFGRCTAE